MIVAISMTVAQAPGEIVRDGRSADAALGADHRDDPAERLGARRAEQMGDRLDEFDDAERRDQIFADPARDQLAIENDVVELAKDDDLGAGVADIARVRRAARSARLGLAGASSTITLGVGALR